jgi:hypothetical protein
MKKAEYTSAPYPPQRPTREESAAHRGENSSDGQAAKPTLRIETTTVDTGERQEMFGRTARHSITTTKQIPLEGSQQQPSETVTDGWYFDVDRRLSCEPAPEKGKGALLGFVTVGSATGGLPFERPEFVESGPRETGFPVKEVRRTTPGGVTTFPDGTQQVSDPVIEREVVALEEGPVDPQLFEVPEGFQQVERFTRDR